MLMRRITTVFWVVLALLSALWLLADPSALQPAGFLPLRGLVVQLSGLLAMAASAWP
jgi:hypothetical protein